MSNPIQANYVRFGTSNMVLPPEGPRVMPLTLDFRDDSEIELGFVKAMTDGKITGIQSIYVDNSLNENALSITADQTQHRVTFPPKSQGFLPMYISDSATLYCRTPAAGNLLVQVIASNTPVNPFIWKVE